mgnify:CR=1 FL=1
MAIKFNNALWKSDYTRPLSNNICRPKHLEYLISWSVTHFHSYTDESGLCIPGREA